MKKNLLLLIVILFSGLKQASPNTITTLQPVVTMDTNAVCAGSVIDVPFYSTGTFSLNNSYTIELSNSAGSFANPVVIGTFASSVTYDPGNPTPGYPPPGYVAGRIPDTMSAGTNYLIRIVSSNPATIGAQWGPFSIQRCDIITNNGQDINICLPDTATVCVAVNINAHFYNNNATYLTGNQFRIQLISRGPIPPPFTEAGTLGMLGTVTATNDITFNLCVNRAMLQAWGLPAGTYYIRMVATNSSLGGDSAFGSLVRITIGMPSSTPLVISSFLYPQMIPQDTFCTGDIVYFTFSPFPVQGSTYGWYSTQLQGSPIIQNNLLVDFIGFSGTFSVYVGENSAGCLGSPSATYSIYVRPPPNVNISPPVYVCAGDTAQYSIPFQSGVVTTWYTSNSATIVSTSNNSAQIVFNIAGIDTVFVVASDMCSSRTGFRKVTVYAYPAVPSIIQSNDTLICTVAATVIRWYKNSVLQPAYNNMDTIAITIVPTDWWTVEVSTNSLCVSGSLPFQPVVGIDELMNEEGISIFPNPVATEFRIRNQEHGTRKVEIYDVLGNKVYENVFPETINVTGWSNGIYFVQLKASNETKTAKLVVQH